MFQAQLILLPIRLIEIASIALGMSVQGTAHELGKVWLLTG
ncbi:hypothetical protein [Dehalogenimonas sp. 4OHTPN]|uniref:Uncharacterized protein n=1 Tax=Dehalogenimonas sp. 4OHTPN TaxID=3166643 RepID=A0AAU8GBD0_9CHLR